MNSIIHEDLKYFIHYIYIELDHSFNEVLNRIKYNYILLKKNIEVKMKIVTTPMCKDVLRLAGIKEFDVNSRSRFYRCRHSSCFIRDRYKYEICESKVEHILHRLKRVLKCLERCLILMQWNMIIKITIFMRI